jgi:hypothetical protein
MDLKDYTDEQLLASLEAEIAKGLNELRCLQGDADKVSARLKFALAVLHIVKSKKDKKD